MGVRQFQLDQIMGMKLATNEFVAMLQFPTTYA